MHLRAGGDALAELGDVVGAEEVRAAVGVGADAVGELRGEIVDDPEGEGGQGEIVRQPGLAGLVPRFDCHVPVEDQLPVVVRDDDRLALLGHLLPVPYGLGQYAGHVRPALDGGSRGAVGAGGVHAGEQFGDRRQQHAGLTERGQHVADVAEEGRVGPDDQHGPLGELFPVRVQQIRGPVQRDRGLPGARPSLDDEHPALRGADDVVLLGLDGRDDVAHPARAGAGQRGEQHLVGVVRLVSGAGGVGEIHDLVVQVGDRASLRGDVPPAAQPHRFISGREIERPRDGSPPVDQQWGPLGVVLPDSDAPDVMGDSVAPVDTSETESRDGGIQRGERGGVLGDADIALHPRLSTGAELRDRGMHGGFGRCPELVEPLVGEGDELLFLPHFLA